MKLIMLYYRRLLAAFSRLSFALVLASTMFAQQPAAVDPTLANDAKQLETRAADLLRTGTREDRQAALAVLDKAVELYLRAGMKSQAASVRNRQGVQFRLLGDRSGQLTSYESALELYRSANHREGEALSLFNIAFVYQESGDTDRAIHYLKLCLAIFEAEKSLYYQSMVLRSFADLYRDLGSIRDALAYKEKALAVDRELGESWNEADTLSEIAQLYAELGDNNRALDHYQKALALVARGTDLWSRSKVHNKLGQHYLALGEVKKAEQHHIHALRLIRQLQKGYATLQGEASTLVHIGGVHAFRRNWKRAEAAFTQARSILRRIGDPAAEAWALQRIALMHMEKAEFAVASQVYSAELQIRRRVGDKPGEALALYRLSRSHAKRGSKRLAVLFGKLSVNTYQGLRATIKEFEPEVRKRYLTTVESAYKDLADLLIEEGRLPEAQAVLAMLKEEEAFEFLRRDSSETASLSKRSDLRDDEKQALKQYEELAEKLGSIGAEFGRLQEAKNKLAEGATLSATDQMRFDEVAKQLEQANTAFQVFLRQLADEFAKRSSVVDDIRENAGLQSDLKNWGDGVVSLYTIVGEDRYRVILTTPDIQIDGRSDIKASELNRKIAEFRATLQDPRSDPRPLGRALYDILIKPVEKQLEGANAKTLLWSLDGSLRYLPIAALWDGKQYFGQKYHNVLITLASRTRLSDEPRNDWRMLALGVTAAKQLTEPNGTRVVNFSALPSVREELASIVRDEQTPDDTGVITGRQLIDEEFNERTLKDRLANRYKVVHIASHFAFRPGDMTRSFLLLGDGSALTLDKFKTSPQLKFSGVELLTLSACDTAVGEPDASGKEIESFAVIAQQNGAKAVLATLWPVADESTAAFMTEFYRIKTGHPTASKAEAIRLAQKAMIDGRIKSTGNKAGCRSELFTGGGKETEFKCDPNAPFSHPYFWSPFVLIGNWR